MLRWKRLCGLEPWPWRRGGGREGFIGDGAREEASEEATIALAREETVRWELYVSEERMVWLEGGRWSGGLVEGFSKLCEGLRTAGLSGGAVSTVLRLEYDARLGNEGNFGFPLRWTMELSAVGLLLIINRFWSGEEEVFEESLLCAPFDACWLLRGGGGFGTLLCFLVIGSIAGAASLAAAAVAPMCESLAPFGLESVCAGVGGRVNENISVEVLDLAKGLVGFGLTIFGG